MSFVKVNADVAQIGLLLLRTTPLHPRRSSHLIPKIIPLIILLLPTYPLHHRWKFQMMSPEKMRLHVECGCHNRERSDILLTRNNQHKPIPRHRHRHHRSMRFQHHTNPHQ
jgi:hypothetical protein